uniref:Cyclin-L2 n=1 Tax=Rhizophora mucronata TaxID=61149 RepID=A0A2P2M3M4_RHIMU
MLELYEQNRLPPSTNSEAEGSTIGGATHHATSKASSGNEEPATTNHYYQAGGAAARPGTMKSVADNQTGPPRSSHNQGNDYGVAEMKSASDHITDSKSRNNLHNEKEILHSPQNIEEAQNATKLFLDRARKDDDQESNTVRSEREAGELKDKHFGRNLEHREGTLSQSPQDAIKRIDRDKVKAALEKRRKSRGDRTRKPDFLDEDDLIERELEDGIELAAETEKSKQDRRQSWTKQTYENTHHAKDPEVAGDGEYQGMKGQLSHKPDLNAVEEGEVWAPDDMDQGLHSPKSSSRKRKAWSSPDRLQEGKHRSDYVAGSNHYSHRDHMDDRNRMSRHSHMERDHKRHVPENHT